MAKNVLFFAWDRPVPGREQISAAHFQEFVKYLEEQKIEGTIESFAPVFLDPHGGDLNGFFLIQGNSRALESLTSSDTWIEHMLRVGFHLEGAGVIGGVTGELLMERMNLWTGLIPD